MEGSSTVVLSKLQEILAFGLYFLTLYCTEHYVHNVRVMLDEGWVRNGYRYQAVSGLAELIVLFLPNFGKH